MAGDIVNHVAPCPSCGHCPTCGRRPSIFPSYPVYPTWPYWGWGNGYINPGNTWISTHAGANVASGGITGALMNTAAGNYQ